jgi:hypothetical protein
VTYTYMWMSGPRIGTEFELEQRISEPALTEHEGERVKRLIACSAPVQFISGPSGGWASSGYSKPECHRWAETQLGRPLTKPGGR